MTYERTIHKMIFLYNNVYQSTTSPSLNQYSQKFIAYLRYRLQGDVLEQ